MEIIKFVKLQQSMGFIHYLFFLLLVPAFTNAQDVLKVVLKESRETYFVLRSDKSVKHGKYDKRGRLNEKIAIGMYTNGERSGIWEFYEEGNLTQKYDFSKHELVWFDRPHHAKTIKYKVIRSSDTLETSLSRPPLYIGGHFLLTEEIFNTANYPKEAYKNGIEGDVLVSFTIDEKGRTSNYKIVKGISYSCDEEAIKNMQKTDGHWIPALLKHETVKVEYIMPVKYRLSD